MRIRTAPVDRRRAYAAALALVLSCLAGCTHVAPYEREYLAHPAMDTKSRQAHQHTFYGHVIEAREGAGALGMNDSSGGGCGCN
jgi:hypothetical protein